MNPEILIVGAGPVGLFTAIEMKLLNPALKIKILDRNKEYSRHHILRLEKNSLIKSLTYKTFDAVKKLNGFVPTSDIESTFLQIAKDLGIEIETGVKVDDCSALLKRFPSAHTIIGADGAHSVVRKQLFGDKKIVDTNLQYIVEIKYKAKGKTSLLPPLTYGPALGQVPYFISENVGKEKEGSTPISLFVFVDKATYQEIRNTPNAHLSDLKPTSKHMVKLLNTIQPWLSLRKAALNEEMVKDSEKINGVTLDIYQSECFAKEIDGKRAYVVGDAAAGVPYFRALNAGLIAATETAKAIATSITPDLEALNKKLTHLIKNEIAKAHLKNIKVMFGIGLNYILANASKITTGALLNSSYERAMLNARVTRPNILRRNPRIVVTSSLFLLTSILLFILITSLSFTIWPAIGLALAGATAIVVPSIFIFKLIGLFMEYLNSKNNPIQPLPEFPWETQDKEEDSLTSLSKLISKPSKEIAPPDIPKRAIVNHPSPLKSQTISAPESTFELVNSP
jgi:2-polyprenyl-6-methoxyphenol hydroxylase-like FAD-dependent oxidoreductase